MLIADEVSGPVDSGHPRSGQARAALTSLVGKPAVNTRGAAHVVAAYQRVRSRATSLERWICLSLQPGLMLIDWPRAL